jgi:hypothetical protein
MMTLNDSQTIRVTITIRLADELMGLYQNSIEAGAYLSDISEIDDDYTRFYDSYVRAKRSLARKQRLKKVREAAHAYNLYKQG